MLTGVEMSHIPNRLVVGYRGDVGSTVFLLEYLSQIWDLASKKPEESGELRIR